LARPFAVRYLEEVRLTLRVQLVRSLPAAEHCVAAFAPFEPHVAWNEDFLRTRLRCYELTRHPLRGQAGEDLEDFLAAAPPSHLDPRAHRSGG
ncbi:MAG: hypothetical protein GY856_38520, partial [bacterium]|nr:hypothetical protein [bacterium]